MRELLNNAIQNTIRPLVGEDSSIIPIDPELKMWIDASDELSITESSGIVSSIADKSGNGNDVTAISTPSTGLYKQNNLNHIQTYGLNDAFSGNFEITGQLFSFFIVARVNEVANVNSALFTFTDSSGLKTNIIAQDAIQFEANGVSSNHLTFNTVQGPYGYNYHVYCYTMSAESPGSVNLQIDGVTKATTALYAPWALGTASMQLGRDSGLLNYVDMDLAEFRYYDSSLSATEIQDITNELISKWEILDLRSYYGSNLRGYWDFSNIASLTYSSGNEISVVNDLSTRNKDLTTTAATNEPTGLNTNQNGLSIASFDGVDDFLTVSGLVNFSSFTVYIVAKINPISAGNISDSLFSIDSTGNDFQFQANSTTAFNGKLETNYNGDITSSSPPAPYDTGEWQIFSLHFNETGVGAITLYQNNVLVASRSTASGVIPSGDFRLACDRLNANFLSSEIGECATTQNPTTPEQRTTVYNYLKAKWNI